jgi:hypothetical protein
MEEVLSFCGYRCDRCPAYYKNLKSFEDRQRVSVDWARYYDLKVEPDQVDCRGCVEAAEAPNPNCKVRPCAIERHIPHCAECDDFVCDKIRKQMDAIKPIAEKHGRAMPHEDYDRYIRPYESEACLRRLRGEGR